MSRLGRIAGIPAGSWTKWLVVGFWLIVVVVAYPLQAKLTGAEKNERTAALTDENLNTDKGLDRV